MPRGRGRRAQQNTVERNIFFYRIKKTNNTTGNIENVQINNILTQLNNLPFNEQGRYQTGNDGENYCVWIGEHRHLKCLDFGTIRRSGLPQMERGGQLLNLPMRSNAGLAEITNIVFFPSDIFGAVFNFYGPRPTRLASYINEKIALEGDIIIEPLIKQDAIQQLETLRTIQLFDMKIKTSFITSVETADRSLADSFRAIKEYCEPQTIHILLSSSRKRSDQLLPTMSDKIKRILRLRNLHEEAVKLTVSGINENQEKIKIDLLNDKLVSKKAILRQSQRTRALVKVAAYDAVIEAYGELRNQLQHAGGVRI